MELKGVLSGREIMDLWDRICTILQTRTVIRGSVEGGTDSAMEALE